VTVFEKEKIAGGLASGIRENNWEWWLEKFYYHFFPNDSFVFSLAKEVDQEIILKRPITAIYYNPHVQNSKLICPFDSPTDLLAFPYLSLPQKIRTGMVLAYLKLTGDYHSLEKYTAYEWLTKFMGKTAFEILFKPLFVGKFGDYADSVNMAWFWARIKKRTPRLAYPAGGSQSFINKIVTTVEKHGGKVLLNTPVDEIKMKKNSTFYIVNCTFDVVISTLPIPIFLNITRYLNLPSNYIKQLTSVNHLSALNLILELKEPFFRTNKEKKEGRWLANESVTCLSQAEDDTLRSYNLPSHPQAGPALQEASLTDERDRHLPSTPPYWLNINDRSLPFLALVEHTNFMDKKYYGNHHLLYVGNYLPDGHPYLTKSKGELLSVFDPFLKAFNPNYQLLIINYRLSIAPYAQPIITTNYQPPPLGTGLKNLYSGHLNNVYPWDRGTNYAIELGEKLASLIK
jgi:protoporphyrinogen oxidase